MLALVVCFCQQQGTRVLCRSRKAEPACRAPVSLPMNTAPRPRPCLRLFGVHFILPNDPEKLRRMRQRLSETLAEALPSSRPPIVG
ncbi:hypothetical protein Y032_0142g2323 [Ancylostoma ceylanicum]|uniref:Uncharacterized protein n=1 Tax=Ancylostoma ceylanicum TaxID=53326 RepID=A0A016T3Q2_9BILA|nr:hypothetical protein Y032_0142g2323 [Ancylostoma ceylanicum]